MSRVQLKNYAKTERSRRRIPLRGKVVDALKELQRREGILFPASAGGRINIDNFRSREWVPAFIAAGVEHRRIYDMRHTFATWSLAAGMSIFTLARRMGTSVQMIDQTYGHLARDAEDQDRGLLDRYDGAENARGHVWARLRTQPSSTTTPRTKKAPLSRGFLQSAPERIRTSDLRFRRPTLYPAELRALVALRRGSLAPAPPGTGSGASASLA